MPDERPAEPKSFWATLPGIMTAFAGVCAALATLVTALFSAGLLGKPSAVLPPTPAATAPAQVVPTPAPAAPAPTRVEPDDRSQAELAETKRKLEEATRARQRAEEARARADAEAARLRQAQAAAAAEAKRAAEGSRATPGAEPARATPSYDNAPTRDAVTSFRVVSTSGEEMDIEIAFSYDPRVHGDRVLAGVHLRYQGTIITGYKPTAVSWQRGKSVVRVIVRTVRGRQSDELEVFLYKSGEKPFLTRRFPFAFTLS